MRCRRFGAPRVPGATDRPRAATAALHRPSIASAGCRALAVQRQRESLLRMMGLLRSRPLAVAEGPAMVSRRRLTALLDLMVSLLSIALPYVTVLL